MQAFLSRRLITAAQVQHVRRIAAFCDTGLPQIAIGEELVTAAQYRRTLSQLTGIPELSAQELGRATPVLGDIPPAELIRTACFPCELADGTRVLALSEPMQDDHPLGPYFADWELRLADRHLLQQTIARHSRNALLRRSQARPAPEQSCRDWHGGTVPALLILGVLLLTLVSGVILTPITLTLGLVAGSVLILCIATLLKTAAFVANLRQWQDSWALPPNHDHPPLPRISILVPMFREGEIAQTLIARLRQLTYPKALLDVVLVVEEEDAVTQTMLARTTLPRWMRVVVVPEGGIKTKPHAMNYALDFCDGEIIGVYDAEDAPDPDQLTQVARRFQSLPPEVACLQGVLDYYNASQTWLARCFTIEYATWFRMILPGLCRLGFAIPLGGTTLFVRRTALEAIGAWDAHNVTEDADLGFRLARYGYRTEMTSVVTDEEANCRALPWIKQRSRWLKGYMMTYLVHMRRPRQLLRDLGWWRFVGFHAHFLSAIFQFLLAPVLWSFWVVIFGLPHPLSGVLPDFAFLLLGSLFLSFEVINLIMYMTAVSGPKHKHLLLYTPTMHIYWTIGVFAALKAGYEAVFKPFFWDKTWHGWSLPGAEPSAAQSGLTAQRDRASQSSSG